MRTKLTFVLAALLMMFGCTEENPQFPVQRPNGLTPTHDFPYYADFPIECGNLVSEGSDVEVTIEVTSLDDRNFVFEFRPGAYVQSFKFGVYPIAQLYNNLLNYRNAYPDLWSSDPIKINELIRTFLFNEGGSGGYAISIEDYTDPNDFLQIEYDWMSTSYAEASAIAIPDCGFLIAVSGSTETSISSDNAERVNLCYVHTDKRDIVGNPMCEIEVQTGYRQFAVKHLLNQDAAGIYYYGGIAEEIDEYIETFGDTMFRDYVRTIYASPITPENPDNLAYLKDYGQEASHLVNSTSVAIAVDANLTPQEHELYTRQDFNLKEIPANQKIVKPTLTIDETKVAAAYFEFLAEMPAECKTFFYRVYTAEEKAEWDKLLDADVKRILEAIDIADSGYGAHNPNFDWDPVNKAPIGTAGTVREAHWGDLVPGETYHLGYVGRNGFGTLSALAFSEPFTLDQRNLTSFADCKVKDLELTVTDVGRESFTWDVTYDPETVSMVYIQYMTPDNKPENPNAAGTYLTVNSSWTDWTKFIFDTVASKTPQVNVWWRDSSGHDGVSWTGLTPDTEYTTFVCAEDFDGNVSDMQFVKVTTKPVQVGPDPKMKFNLVTSPLSGYDWRAIFTIDKDVESFTYTHFTANDIVDKLKLTGVNNGTLNDIANSGIPYEDWRTALAEFMVLDDLGLAATGESSYVDWSGEDVVLATCCAKGRNAENNPVYRIYNVICRNGEFQTLEEVFNIEGDSELIEGEEEETTPGGGGGTVAPKR